MNEKVRSPILESRQVWWRTWLGATREDSRTAWMRSLQAAAAFFLTLVAVSALAALCGGMLASQMIAMFH